MKAAYVKGKMPLKTGSKFKGLAMDKVTISY